MEENTTAQTSPSKKSPLGWIAFVIVVLVLGAASFTVLQNNPRNNNQNQDRTPQPSIAESESIAPNTFVYGSWTGSGSEITAIDLSNRTISTVATLPISIKNVSILSPDRLLYIGDTDVNDHGSRLVVYDIKNKKEIASIPADSGFGIDDYVLSPDNKYVATWELSLSEEGVVLGGRSRVYAINLSNPSVKNLLYDETVSEDAPANYPRAILNNGRVFTDKTLPNKARSNDIWAYGMSVSDFNGGNQQEIASMAPGTYGTKPQISPDGTSFVFAGYDGSRGDGNNITATGFRQAALTPNTIELLNTTTLEREKIENLPTTNIYSNVFWGSQDGKITYTQLSGTVDDNGQFSYNIASGGSERIELPGTPDDPYALLGNLTEDISLVGKSYDSDSDLANLGGEYAAFITDLYARNSTTGDLIGIRLDTSLAQYIDILPANYFSDVLGVAHAQGGNPADPNVTIFDFYSDKPSQENLQLKTFLLKPEIKPVREKQQSLPARPPTTFEREETISCRDLAKEQCLALGYEENSPGYRNCFMNAWDANRATKGTPDAVCNKSPLYVYGTPGQSINVKIHTSVYNDSPSYDEGYSITIGNNGEMIVDGKTYQAIDYDYRSNLRRIMSPAKGRIAARADVEKTLREYAGKLGLNEKETNDLVGKGKSVATSPYVFISFFDQATSQAILPLSFTPEPDNYRNIVFYFKLLDEAPNYSVAPPDFEPINRSGLTVVEISEIVE